MRFRFIAVEKARYIVTILCRCLAVTRSGFYAWHRRPDERWVGDTTESVIGAKKEIQGNLR